MKHYDYVEWVFYKEKVLSNHKNKEMEDHLYICDDCMDTFLSFIDKDEVDRAEGVIPTGFTNSVVSNIQKIKYKSKTKIEKHNEKFKDMFVYYVAVASVAIILTLGGFYSGLVDVLPQVAKSTIEKESIKTPNLVSNLSQTIVNKTSSFINDFEISNYKEELK